MKKEFVTYEIAKGLKDIGFNAPCFGYFSKEGVFYLTKDGLCHNYEFGQNIATPLWQQAFYWFIQKYNLNGTITYTLSGQWNFYIQKVEAGLMSGAITEYKTNREFYVDAQIKCMENLINIVKEKQSGKNKSLLYLQ